jgi:hypothetical protein
MFEEKTMFPLLLVTNDVLAIRVCVESVDIIVLTIRVFVESAHIIARLSALLKNIFLLPTTAGHGATFRPHRAEVPVHGVPPERPAGVARPGGPARQVHGPARVHGRHPRQDGLRDPPPDVLPAAAPAPHHRPRPGDARRRRHGDRPRGLAGALRAVLVRGQGPQALRRAAARPPDRAREGCGDGGHRGMAAPQGLTSSAAGKR